MPAVLGEVFAVFHPVGLTGDGGELKVHSVGGGLEGGNAGLARGVERVGAAGALSAVEGARSSSASGIPSPSLFKQSSSAMRLKKSLNVIMITDHVEIKQSTIGCEDQA